MPKILASCCPPPPAVVHPIQYEYANLHAEYTGTLVVNGNRWSYGGRQYGSKGIRLGARWELLSLSLAVDLFAAASMVEVQLHNWTNADTAAIYDIGGITINGAGDGGGQVNNAHKLYEFPTPIPIPDPSLTGFITRAMTGTVSDAVVYARFRRIVFP